MKSNEPRSADRAPRRPPRDAGPSVGLADLLTWIGEGKRLIAIVTIVAAIAALIYRAASAVHLHRAHDAARAEHAAERRLGRAGRARRARRPGRRPDLEVARRALRRAAEGRQRAARADRPLQPEGALPRRDLRDLAQGAAELPARLGRQEERPDHGRGRRRIAEVRRRPRERACRRSHEGARPPRGLGGAAAPRLLREPAEGDQGEPGPRRAGRCRRRRRSPG